MPHALVEDLIHALHAALTHKLDGGAHALTFIAYRILRSRNEQQRQVVRHALCAGRRRHLSGKVGEGRIAAHGEHRTAQRVGDEGVHHVGVDGQPVEGRASAFDTLAVGARAHAVDKRTPAMLPCEARDQAREQVARLRQSARRVARAAENRGGQPVPVTRQVGAHDETAHGMAEQDVGDRLAHTARHLLATLDRVLMRASLPYASGM